MRLEIEIKGTEVIDSLAVLFPKAVAKALNKTAGQMRTDVSKEIRVHYNVKSGPVRRGLSRMRQATPKLLKTGVRAKGKALSLIHFGVSPAKPVSEGGSRPKVGVSVRIKKKEGRRKMRGMFVARKRNTRELAVMKRTGRARLPIREEWGPGIPKMLQTGEVIARVQKKAVARLNKNVDRQIRHEAAKAGAR